MNFYQNSIIFNNIYLRGASVCDFSALQIKAKSDKKYKIEITLITFMTEKFSDNFLMTKVRLRCTYTFSSTCFIHFLNPLEYLNIL